MQDKQTANTTVSTKGFGKQIGGSGTYIHKGYITQEDYNTKLNNNITANKIYEIMRRSDPTVRSTLQVCKLPITSVTWSLEAASDDPLDQEVHGLVEREMFKRNVNFNDFLREALTMFDFGFSLAEKTYELTDYEGKTRIGIQSLGFRKQKSIQAWEMDNGKLGVKQQLQDKVVNIPMAKLVVFTNDKEGDNYQGTSLLRYAYKPWDIKDKLDIVNAIALEKLAVGVPIITSPADVNPRDKEAAIAVAQNIRANENSYQSLPEGWSIEMLDMKANSTKDVLPTIQYLDRQIQASVLAQFLSLGSTGGSGSRSLSEDHSKLFLLSEEASAKNVQSTIQQQVIKQLCDLNYADLPNGYPQLKFSKIGNDDVTTLAESISKLLTAGAINYDRELEEHLREVMHLPDMPDEETTEDKPTKKIEVKPADKENLDEEEDDDVQASAIKDALAARERLLNAIVS